jgi:hypothetical protein
MIGLDLPTGAHQLDSVFSGLVPGRMQLATLPTVRVPLFVTASSRVEGPGPARSAARAQRRCPPTLARGPTGIPAGIWLCGHRRRLLWRCCLAGGAGKWLPTRRTAPLLSPRPLLAGGVARRGAAAHRRLRGQPGTHHQRGIPPRLQRAPGRRGTVDPGLGARHHPQQRPCRDRGADTGDSDLRTMTTAPRRHGPAATSC